MGTKVINKSKDVRNGVKVKKDESATKKRSVPYDPMAVTWMDNYSETMDKIWERVPEFSKPFIVFLAVFIMGATMRGEWLVVLVHLLKYMGVHNDVTMGNLTQVRWSEVTMESLHLNNLVYYWIGTSTISYTMYFAIGGFLHWYYYLNRRDRPHEWKCQPEKFLPPDLERNEIILGSLSLLVTNTVSALTACYISNGGWSYVYHDFSEYSWAWWFLQWAVIFVYQDYMTYWIHRVYHTPFLYKNFHKMHHKYKQPTAFSVTAIHPVEILHIQITLMLPIFFIPLHFIPFYAVALYTYYHGIIDHSGINFKAHWWQPWQPDAIFHDNHHQYFHVNFGFNCSIWDKIHGTYRRKDRIYTEDIYYGKGKALNEVSENELMNDIKERKSENPLAYRNNNMEFELTEEDIKKSK
uniref:Fatty acid hydroxylase domain-containing protein n=1 Tax=Timema douglasi TaxID=61478 RepID=A0A7R8VNC6_TIMDO|nr:unnamed protein product [Timema douglasi]